MHQLAIFDMIQSGSLQCEMNFATTCVLKVNLLKVNLFAFSRTAK